MVILRVDGCGGGRGGTGTVDFDAIKLLPLPFPIPFPPLPFSRLCESPQRLPPSSLSPSSFSSPSPNLLSSPSPAKAVLEADEAIDNIWSSCPPSSSNKSAACRSASSASPTPSPSPLLSPRFPGCSCMHDGGSKRLPSTSPLLPLLFGWTLFSGWLLLREGPLKGEGAPEDKHPSSSSKPANISCSSARDMTIGNGWRVWCEWFIVPPLCGACLGRMGGWNKEGYASVVVGCLGVGVYFLLPRLWVGLVSCSADTVHRQR